MDAGIENVEVAVGLVPDTRLLEGGAGGGFE